MKTETQNPEANAATAGDLGSEEAVIAALSQLGEAPEPEKQEPESNPDDGETPPEDTESEPEEGDTEEEPKGAETVEVEYEGKTYAVPSEIQKALLRQSDYSRKMNEVGEVEKVAKSRNDQAEKLIAGAEKFIEVLAEVNGIDAQIARFEKLDWAQLRTENPAEYAALIADRQTLDASRKAVVDKAKGIDAEISSAKQIQTQEMRLEMLKTLQKDLKGWGDDLGGKITAYAIEQGYTPEFLGSLTDAKVVIALDKARRYDAMQKEKTALHEKVKDVQKFVKPGAPRVTNKVTELRARFQKTPTAEDAIKLLS